MNLTPEQYELLAPYEETLMKAAKYAHIFIEERNRTFPPLKELYVKITGQKPSCSSCGGTTKWINRLGIWYRDYKLKNL